MHACGTVLCFSNRKFRQDGRNGIKIYEGKKMAGRILFLIKMCRVLPAYWMWKRSENAEIIRRDMLCWKERKHFPYEKDLSLFAHLMLEAEGFRNLFQYRIRKHGFLLKRLFPPMNTLFIGSEQIGAGLYIQHGFSTIICARSIGEECWINQQVTIGYEQDRMPVIGNHVRICAGAIVIGDVTIGDNSIVAAGAVVTRDVPPGEIWGGSPARFIKKVKGSSFDDQR